MARPSKTRAKSKKKTTSKKVAKAKKPAASRKKVSAPARSKLSLNTYQVATAAHLELWQKSTAELETLLKTGSKPALEALDGWRFRGLNVGFGARLIGVQKFIKVFATRDYGYGQILTGNNIVVKQNKAEEAYTKKTNKEGSYKIQGVYLVEADNINYRKYPNAAMLNYGRGDNPWYEPAKFLRDYLVQPYADNPDLLLGKAYFKLGFLNIMGGYFVLERLEKIEE